MVAFYELCDASIEVPAPSVFRTQVGRVVLGRLLESLGYKVTIYRTGEEAVQFYARKHGTISCIWLVWHFTIL